MAVRSVARIDFPEDGAGVGRVTEDGNGQRKAGLDLVNGRQDPVCESARAKPDRRSREMLYDKIMANDALC